MREAPPRTVPRPAVGCAVLGRNSGAANHAAGGFSGSRFQTAVNRHEEQQQRYYDGEMSACAKFQTPKSMGGEGVLMWIECVRMMQPPPPPPRVYFNSLLFNVLIDAVAQFQQHTLHSLVSTAQTNRVKYIGNGKRRHGIFAIELGTILLWTWIHMSILVRYRPCGRDGNLSGCSAIRFVSFKDRASETCWNWNLKYSSAVVQIMVAIDIRRRKIDPKVVARACPNWLHIQLREGALLLCFHVVPQCDLSALSFSIFNFE